MAENVSYVNDDVVNTSESGVKNEIEAQDGASDYEVPMADPSDVAAFAGMPKEVLLRYSRQKRYVWAREFLTVIVFVTVFILLGLVIAVVATSPPCLKFWQTSPIYQIYPKSFRCSNDNNGYGDIKGIVEKLDYLKDNLGVQIVALNSVYESGRIEKDYEIQNFRQIDPTFGSMEDMDNLIVEVHNRGMKLIVDFVPNQSSDKHKWFVASSNTTHPDHEKYKDYYVWVNGSASSFPNNWEADVGPAWTWNADRQLFYYHTFSSAQPDLNLRNKDVKKELKEILRFWLQKGVDGFRSVGTAYLLEARHLRSNPLKNPALPASKENLFPDYTEHYKGVHDIVAEWRTLLEEYSTEPGVFRFLETQEDGDLLDIIRYYGTNEAEEADFPMNSAMVRAKATEWNAATMAQKILNWMRNMPSGKWPNWALSTHSGSRIASRAGSRVALCAAVMTMTLPGTPSVYYGDEIGMSDVASTSGDALSPMQWSVDSNAGFCGNCTPWNAVNANYMEGITVQNETKDPFSVLSNYKKLISLRSGAVFQRGYLCVLGDVSGVLVYVRELSGVRSAMVLVNFRNQMSKNISLSSVHPNLPASGSIEYFSGNVSSLQPGRSIAFADVRVPALSGIVISYEPTSMLSRESEIAEMCFIQLKVCYNTGLQVIQYC